MSLIFIFARQVLIGNRTALAPWLLKILYFPERSLMNSQNGHAAKYE
jgi:hypothetical protein